MDPELARISERLVDPETGEELDCTRCGACCESGEGNILIVAEDLVRWRRSGRHDLADNTDEGHFGERAFPTSLGACVYLTRPEGRSICSIYDDRASVCREFQAGSWQCLEFRRDARRLRARGSTPPVTG
jgi:Fe-S-cluster containining protein